MKEDTKKILKLSYVLILLTLSAFLFILPDRNESWVGDTTDKAISRIFFTKYYFSACSFKKHTFNLGYGDRTYINDSCSSFPAGPEKLKLEGRTIYAKQLYKRNYGKDVWLIMERMKEKARNNPSKASYFIARSNVQWKKGAKVNSFLMFILFFASIPYIWYTRNLSIYLYSLIKKGTSKGWKKL